MSDDASIKKTSSPKKSTKKSSAAKKTSPFESADFLKELQDIFTQTPLIPSASEFMNAFKNMKMIPTKWTPNTIRAYLTEIGVITYSKTKPQGYSLNSPKLNECIAHPPSLVDVTSESKENVTESISGTPQSNIPEVTSTELKSEMPQVTKKLSKKKISPETPSSPITVNPDVKSSESGIKLGLPSSPSPEVPTPSSIVEHKSSSHSISPSVSDSSASLNVTSLPPTPSEKPKETHVSSNLTEQQILERIPSIPRYLMDRMSRDAQKYFMMGLLDINRLPSDKVERGIEYLSGARMFFDTAYENEKEVLTFLDKKVAFMNRRLGELKEKEAEEKIRKNFMEPFLKGKFDKITRKIGSGSSIENAAWEIVEKMGRDARNIPLSEIALRRKIEEVLKERYGKK